jgi:homoserine dehydrogenase
MRILLAGCGVVGGALVRLLAERSDAIERKHGVRPEVVQALVRDRSKPRPDVLQPDRVTTDLATFLAADGEIVVDAMGGCVPALEIARHALTHRAGLVSANKAVLAVHGAELARRAAAHGSTLSFEAAVAGGVPVIRVLRDALGQAGVRRIRGVLNGTTNFVLGRMEEGSRFDEAVAEAQALGFAEADPERDLNGQDAADKIRLLAWEAFGVDPARLPLEPVGLLPDPDRLVADARAAGRTVRLLAEAVRTARGVTATVQPVAVERDSTFGRAAGEENVVEFESDTLGTVRLSGPGAGGRPTAAALLGDLLAIAPRRRGLRSPRTTFVV